MLYRVDITGDAQRLKFYAERPCYTFLRTAVPGVIHGFQIVTLCLPEECGGNTLCYFVSIPLN